MHFLPWAWWTIGTLLAHRAQEARKGRTRQLDYEVVRVTGWIKRMRGQHQLVIEPRLQTWLCRVVCAQQRATDWWWKWGRTVWHGRSSPSSLLSGSFFWPVEHVSTLTRSGREISRKDLIRRCCHQCQRTFSQTICDYLCSCNTYAFVKYFQYQLSWTVVKFLMSCQEQLTKLSRRWGLQK